MSGDQPARGAASTFDVERFGAEREARGASFGTSIHWAELTGSTNDDALAAARADAAHGSVFGAETQTGGRGRRGSTWVSTPGAGLWFSVLLRPALSAELAAGLALSAGLALRQVVALHVRGPVQVKWPNDVLASGRKIAGVLVESQLSGARLACAVVGIGLNVTQTQFPEPIASVATSLQLLGAAAPNREALLADVLEAFEGRLSLVAASGIAGIAEELRNHDALLGRRARVEERIGTCVGIDDSGRLLLRLASGAVEACTSGHVELLDERAA